MIKYLLLSMVVCSLVHCQDEEEDRGLLHKKKKRPRPGYGGGYGSPCGFGRDLSAAGTEEDSRSLPLLAAAGGAAAGYYLGNKLQHKYQQPVVNNYIGGIGGYPCGGQASPPHGGHGGGIGSHLGGHLSNHLASHVGNGGVGGLLAGLGGNRNGYGYGGYSSGINWDRTIRQFNRNIVRPLAYGWF